MIKISLPVLFIFFITYENTFSKNYNCELVYAKCFENIPVEMISYYETYKKIGVVNKDNINLRNIPVINSSNSKIIGKLYKNDELSIEKIFFVKNNTYVDIQLANSGKERVNNYRYNKWYQVSNGDISGFVFFEFVDIKKKQLFFDRYRHIDSVDLFKDKIKLSKSIEIIITKDSSTNTYNLKGYAWHYNNGYSEIEKIFSESEILRKYFQDKDTKVFFFDEKEIYIESSNEIFTGIYKKF